MPNLFLALPAPAANGSGAWVDVSTMGAPKSVIIGGGAVAQVTIEATNELVPLNPCPLGEVQSKGLIQGNFAVHWMRATVSGYKSGAPNVDVGSNDEGCSFLQLVAPAGDGVGAAVDVSALGFFKTVTVANAGNGTVIIEISEDNVVWNQFVSYQADGAKSFYVTASHMRVSRLGSRGSVGLPIVWVGADNDVSGTNPFPTFETPQTQRFVAAGGENDFNVVLTTPRLNDIYSVWATLAGVASIVGIDMPDTLAGDRTTLQFRVVTAAPLTAGDIIDFLIAGR